MAPADRNPELAERIANLRLKIAPFVPEPYGGPPHSSYPKMALHFWLLTEDQLDSIAHYYHQSTPNEYTNRYPTAMGWDKAFFARLVNNPAKRVEIKRRKFGKFIGIKGCETPTEEIALKLRLLEEEMNENMRRLERRMSSGRKWS